MLKRPLIKKLALSLLSLGLAVPMAVAKTAKKASVKTEGKSKDSAKDPSKELNTVLTEYRQASALKAKVKKTVTQEALGTEMKSEGDFYFSKGRMRMEIREPERSTLVYDGKNVWFETPMEDERVHVTKMRANELKRSDSLLTALFDRKDLLKNFKLKSAKAVDGKKTFAFEPKDKKKSEVQMLEVTLKDKSIQRISYKDQMENRVTLEFSDVKKGSVPADKFAYKVPKKAELTEM